MTMSTSNLYYRYFKRDSRIVKFIRHLDKQNSKIVKTSNDKNGEILLEVSLGFPRYLSYSFFTREFLKLNSTVIGYHPKLVVSAKTRALQKFFSVLPIDNGLSTPYRILNAIGVTKYIRPKIYRNWDKADQEITNDLDRLVALGPDHLAHFQLSGILIGDLLYDWHMRTRKVASPNLDSEEFKMDFVLFIRAFNWWLKYFDNHKVIAVMATHAVYDQGLPVRIAIQRNIETFIVSGDRNYRLDSFRKFPDLEFMDYIPFSGEQFSYKVDLNFGRKALHELSSGSATLDAAHAVVSGFRGNGEFKVPDKSNKLRVLIAAHCFEDAPHASGSQVFEDFMAWLEFLGEISSQTQYFWMIKMHPFFSESDKAHFYAWAVRFPQIMIIPGDVSNQSLFAQGIDAIFTVHGTIAFEAAFNDVLVVSSAKLSPHMNYKFSINAQSKSELESIILELPKIKKIHHINKEEVIHFYALHHLRSANHWLWRNQTWSLLNAVGGYTNLPSSPLVLDFWLRRIHSFQTQLQLEKEVKEFIQSNRYLLQFNVNDFLETI